jgi:hypothetical protein
VLLRVGLARKRIGELDLRFVLRRVERRRLRGRFGIQVVAMDVDPQTFVLLFDDSG